MNKMKPTSPETQCQNAKGHRLTTAVFAGSTLLAACGGASTTASPERVPVVTEASPSEIPDSETTHDMPPMNTTEPTNIESPNTTFVDQEEPGGETGDIAKCSATEKVAGVFCSIDSPLANPEMSSAEKAQRVIDQLHANINFGIYNDSAIHIEASIGPEAQGFLSSALDTMNVVSQPQRSLSRCRLRYHISD